MNKLENLQRKTVDFSNRPKPEKKFTQKEVVLDFLASRPDDWFFVWELMGPKRLGFISHKVDCALSELSRNGLVEIGYINKYAVYSIKQSV